MGGLGCGPEGPLRGRRLKLLLVGNIANNAAIDARLLREAGHEVHVAAYDFYHFAGSSEWLDVAGAVGPETLGSLEFPDFWRLGRRKPPVPRWFAHGPQRRVLTYLNLLARGERRLADIAWRCLQYARFKVTQDRRHEAGWNAWTEARYQAAVEPLDLSLSDRADLDAGRLFERLLERVRDAQRRFYDERTLRLTAPPFDAATLDALAAADPVLRAVLAPLRANGVLAAAGLLDDGEVAAGSTPEGVAAPDVAPYAAIVPRWRALMRRYDLAVMFGPEPLLGFLANERPYLAYEHGTLRDIPFEDTTLGRLLRDAYSHAAAVLITNNDYLTQARQLPIEPSRLRPAPHPFDERPLRAFAAARGRARERIVTFFAPARQDWVGQYRTLTKNNHWVVRAAARLRDAGARPFRVDFVEWGADVEATRALIAELGVEAHFAWVPPANKHRLWAHYLDAHAVVDQFLLPSISGVSFEALALGARVITCDDGEANRRAFGEQPPLLAACSENEVEARMAEVLADPEDDLGIGAASAAFIDRCHSARRIVAIQEAAFAKVLEGTAARAA